MPIAADSTDDMIIASFTRFCPVLDARFIDGSEGGDLRPRSPPIFGIIPGGILAHATSISVVDFGAKFGAGLP